MSYKQTEDDYVEAAKLLQQANINYARVFGAARTMPGIVTDRQAQQFAVEETGDAITMAQAMLEIARLRLERFK